MGGVDGGEGGAVEMEAEADARLGVEGFGFDFAFGFDDDAGAEKRGAPERNSMGGVINGCGCGACPTIGGVSCGSTSSAGTVNSVVDGEPGLDAA